MRQDTDYCPNSKVWYVDIVKAVPVQWITLVYGMVPPGQYTTIGMKLPLDSCRCQHGTSSAQPYYWSSKCKLVYAGC